MSAQARAIARSGSACAAAPPRSSRARASAAIAAHARQPLRDVAIAARRFDASARPCARTIVRHRVAQRALRAARVNARDVAERALLQPRGQLARAAIASSASGRGERARDDRDVVVVVATRSSRSRPSAVRMARRRARRATSRRATSPPARPATAISSVVVAPENGSGSSAMSIARDQPGEGRPPTCEPSGRRARGRRRRARTRHARAPARCPAATPTMTSRACGNRRRADRAHSVERRVGQLRSRC